MTVTQSSSAPTSFKRQYARWGEKAAYREHFPGGADFDEQLTLILAGWVMLTFTWGLVTLRQRHLHRLENLLTRPNLTSLLPSVAQVAEELYGILKTRWADLEPMPLYPAFQSAL